MTENDLDCQAAASRGDGPQTPQAATSPCLSGEAISKETMRALTRRLCRRIAATLMQAMAEDDIGFDVLAVRLGKREADVRNWFDCLCDGQQINLDKVSDLFFACGGRVLEFHLVKASPVSQGEVGPQGPSEVSHPGEPSLDTLMRGAVGAIKAVMPEEKPND